MLFALFARIGLNPEITFSFTVELSGICGVRFLSGWGAGGVNWCVPSNLEDMFAQADF
ncbi:hypothetical protein Tsubulata_032916 [Turnera subulata]|uniref:Uncharacterized protein n=1 Tax=Turnera subulata TaxID=218843 RepID=A0A9Q0J6S8_9ROSI|nr:hypothetical protein Tsubulata_032916 [Turnera subulata]